MLKRLINIGLPVLATSFALSPALAQTDGVIEEIIVTAAKRQQTLQEIPIAVSVVTGELIERAQINDILDLQTVVPALRVTQLQTSGNTNFLIRGFGNGANNPGIEPSVGVFIDGVYRSRTSSAMSDLPNLERIEVLRGPQSTLFGKNASAGVISVITAAPNMDGFSGSASVVIGNRSQIIVKGDISGPLSDTVGFSLSAHGNQQDGYFDNLISGSDLNERDRWGVRGQLLFLPSDTITIRVIADYDEIDEGCCGVANLVNGPTGAAIVAVGGQLVAEEPFAREQFLDFDPKNEIENKGISLQADFDLPNDMLITSITAFRNHQRFDNADVDFTSAALISQNSGDTDIDTFTQELRLSQSLDSVDWMIGGYYFDEEVDFNNVLTYGPAFRPFADALSFGGVSGLEAALAPLGIPAGTFFAQGQGTAEFSTLDDETFSIFGQVDWHFNDRTTLTLGANYTEAEKDATLSQINTDVFSGLDFVQIGLGSIFASLVGQGLDPATALAIATGLSTVPCDGTNEPACNPVLALQPLQFLPPFVDFPNSVESGSSSDSETTWTARIAFDASDAINVYASWATGFKATSWNLSRDSRPFPADIAALEAAGLSVNNLNSGTRSAGPEDATVYEVGFKGRWGPHSVNVALFTQEIEDFQSNIFTGVAFSLANAGKQSTDGIEIDAIIMATDSLQLSFSGIWLDPEYDSFPAGAGVNGPEDLSGKTPAGIHEFSITTSATYDFQIGASMTGFVRGEYIFEDEIQIVDNVSKDVASREVNLVNASAGIEWDNGFEVMIWGRNLTDDDFLLSAFPAVAQAGSFSGYPNAPRSYGITLRARFE